MLDAGSAAAFTKNLDFSLTSLSIANCSGNAISTSNRLGLVPPPANLLLNPVMVLSGGLLNWVAIVFSIPLNGLNGTDYFFKRDSSSRGDEG